MDQHEGEALSAQVAALSVRLDSLRDPTGGEMPQTDELVADLEAAHEELRVADEEVRAQQGELERLIEAHHNARWAHERLVAVLPAPVMVTSSAGVIAVANSSMAMLLRVPVNRLVGKPIFAFVASDERAELRTLVQAASRGGDFRATVTLHPRNHDPITVAVAATVQHDSASGAVELTWVLVHAPAEQHGGLDDRLGLATSLVDLTLLPLSTTDTHTLLSQVAAICERAFAIPVAVSVTVGPPATPDAVATSSQLAAQLDGLQVSFGEGPSQSAWASRRLTSTGDLGADPRWPRLSGRVGRTHPVAAAAAPVTIGDVVAGGLNLYSEDAGLVEDTALQSLQLLAAAVGAVLRETEDRAELQTMTANLREALVARATIDQAKGIVMQQQHCTADEAFLYLARLSSRTNVKLRDVAAALVASVTHH